MSGGLEVRGLTVPAVGASPEAQVLVDDLDLDLAPGEIVVLAADDPVSASALLAGLAGLRRTASGRVVLDGEPLLPPDGVAPPDRLGYVGASHLLLGSLTPVENLAVLLVPRLPHADVVPTATARLESLGLPASSWHNLVEQLSGGQQQRVAVARALVCTPRLLLLDDPTSELDPASAELVADALLDAAAGGAVVVLSTDDPALGGIGTRLDLGTTSPPGYRPRRALL